LCGDPQSLLTFQLV